ncbi:hypothetical protein AYL99_11771 [Fonsecaea erecta]|uniref:non-specific serine/threonine protein kinase n=1 Tax=Fonsecaea erecta TaxID=1367422 RepID=A0A178Z3B8_9EURO|nr:hypothetical protein AYL99_11771 [Fonsecaea erecta]OAP54011.1 hypothetical protein AYL99_11771 [Fonsecaea erecta]
MELVPGMSLEKFVDNQFHSTLTEMQCMDIWLGAAQGLLWVHQNGFLYNDLKPDNTMYDPSSRRTVLIDFGLASSETCTYFVSGGTACYISPEYLHRERHQAGDIWSLAVMIMFTLRVIELPRETWDLTKVFEEASPHRQKMGAWHDELLAKADKAPSRHLELLRRMLCKNRRDRIWAYELVTDLLGVHQAYRSMESIVYGDKSALCPHDGHLQTAAEKEEAHWNHPSRLDIDSQSGIGPWYDTDKARCDRD